MRPAPEVLARIAVAERHRLDPQRHPSWDELTINQRRIELQAAHRQAEAFGLFGLEARVAGDHVLTRRRLTAPQPDGLHPVQENMARAEVEAMRELP